MTAKERLRRFEAAINRAAESQGNAWDAVDTLAKAHATTAKAIENLTVRLDTLA